ncbi:hypothetical protein [Ramlibacter sp.]|uniref:hypothetical protein n=1 Tax=Ramlibacter sp. TaxID=1917967 RepID=UPI002D4409FD|nr:hypothetical protein [Ramlibacter sp.]HYD76490.1 hypothetical protein [Ramlibacter sp.]
MSIKVDRIGAVLALPLLTLALLPTAAAAAESCSAQLNNIKSRIGSLGSLSDKSFGSLKVDFETATSKDYTKKYFQAFENLNKTAQDATQLVNTGYKLAGYTAPMKEGQIQKTLPTKVTTTMANAQELAQVALDEESTKVDVAQVRCSQSTDDAALGAVMSKLDSGTVSKFKKAQKTACKVVHVVADLQDKRQKLNEIRENGYPLFYLHAKDKKNFSGKERTIQIKADLRLFPIYPDKAMGVDGKDQPILLGQIKGIDLSYNSYFKWSDNNWTTLNLYQYFISDTEKGEVCQPQIKLSSSVKVATCVSVEDITTDYIKVKVRGKYWYNGDSSAVSLGTQKIPAPFGYLADVSDMKEEKMEKLKSKAVDRLASLLGPYGEVVKKAQEWKAACGGA